MNRKQLRYLFIAASVLMLVLMLLMTNNASISCDEVLHHDHSGEVLKYYISAGTDRSCLDTPVSHLKYYGQSYDNLATLLAHILRIEDVYSLRHLMSALAGWLTVLVTALLAVWLSGYGAGLLVMLFFAVSPTFLGHSMNNLKDIPFALGYISSVFFGLKLVFTEGRFRWSLIILTIISVAFTLSIRAGGLIVFCYLFLFYGVWFIKSWFKKKRSMLREALIRLLILIMISGAAWFLGILFWPYALEGPVGNVLESYRVMAHFPGTFRQIFEGTLEWSDYMPWYYLPKSMLITVPLLVLAGVVLFIINFRRSTDSDGNTCYALLVFTILFPVIFVIIERSNLYSSWRQFLFLYPGIVLLAATGLATFILSAARRYQKVLIFLFIAAMMVHPLRFIIREHPYEYLYYNELAGGLKGAHGFYETDYYYTAQTEASEWLISHLDSAGIDSALVKATYSVDWQFRNRKGIQSSYFRFEERSMADWDYAIVTNRYIQPFRLREGLWPPANSIHTIFCDGVPLCAVLERKDKSDYRAYLALENGDNERAIGYFRKALSLDDTDEMIFYNFARALYNTGRHSLADSVLKEGLKVNPDFEPILMYLGNIASAKGESDLAEKYYEKLLALNRKYFDAYVKLAELRAKKDLMDARTLLRSCLKINPAFVPAIRALAETYAETDPSVAGKYYELAESLTNK